MSAENNSDIKLSQNKFMSKYVNRKYVGHILCQQKIIQTKLCQNTSIENVSDIFHR